MTPRLLAALAGLALFAALMPALTNTRAAQPAPGAPSASPPAPPAPATPQPWEIAPDAKPVERRELPGGLVVEDFVIGSGPEVKNGGAVLAHYHGTLKADGTVFDSSWQRGEPAAFPLAAVIEGWQKGIPGMKVGGKRRLTIPYPLAYGDQGRPPVIPPRSDLVFVVELKDMLISEDLKEGDGEAVRERAVLIANHTITTKDGVEVERTRTPYAWIPGEMMGMDYGAIGMKVGGKRRLIVPAPMAESPPGLPPGFPGQSRPTGKDLIIEIELIGLRNLTPPPPSAPDANPANNNGR